MMVVKQNNGRPTGVYLKKLQYEIPYSVSSNINNRYRNQDLLIANSIGNQDSGAKALQSAAAGESTVWSRYGLALRQYAVLITGAPEGPGGT